VSVLSVCYSDRTLLVLRLIAVALGRGSSIPHPQSLLDCAAYVAALVISTRPYPRGIDRRLDVSPEIASPLRVGLIPVCGYEEDKGEYLPRSTKGTTSSNKIRLIFFT
jgi:hypothetical protein